MSTLTAFTLAVVVPVLAAAQSPSSQQPGPPSADRPPVQVDPNPAPPASAPDAPPHEAAPTRRVSPPPAVPAARSANSTDRQRSAPPPATPGQLLQQQQQQQNARPPSNRKTANADDDGDASDRTNLRDDPADLSDTWSYSKGPTPSPRFVPSTRQKLLHINPVGYYQGVTPTGENPPPFAPPTLGVTPAVLTWTGFKRVSADITQVFVQISADIEPEVSKDGMTVTLRLPNTSVNVQNNMRRLDTRFFVTPVTTVDIKSIGNETQLIVKLRRDSEPKLLQEKVNGFSVIKLEFDNSQIVQSEELPKPPVTN